MGNAGGEKIERLVSIFHNLTGKRFDVNMYENRLIMQKLTYLLQIKDKSFNYPFYWFIRGPYSQELTKDEYAYSQKDVHEHTLSEADVKNANFIGELVGETSEFNFELFASVYYLIATRKLTEFEDVYFALHSAKPWFEKNDAQKAFEKLQPLVA